MSSNRFGYEKEVAWKENHTFCYYPVTVQTIQMFRNEERNVSEVLSGSVD